MIAEFKRAIIIVLDSVGIGALPDAAEYGDEGSSTLANTAEAVGGLHLRFFEQLGLGNIVEIPGVPAALHPTACYGRMAERSLGKDTTTGHWEMMGIIVSKPFPLYPGGFPPEIIGAFEEAIGRRVLGNRPASGTQIIEELGEEHLATGRPIVYTSADSVFQIAAHEDIIPPEELYRMCLTARKMLIGRHAVGRVIARPFVGRPGWFRRTARRRDFSLQPPEPTVLDAALEAGWPVYGVGKIDDIFGGRGLTECRHVEDNMEGIDKTLVYLDETDRGIILTNLVDFDTLWGHRNLPREFAKGLEDVDHRVPEILGRLRDGDVLFFTADHGCDPTTPSTDHSREYVPLLAIGPGLKSGVNLGTRKTFADVGMTISEMLGFKRPRVGMSFLSDIVPAQMP